VTVRVHCRENHQRRKTTCWCESGCRPGDELPLQVSSLIGVSGWQTIDDETGASGLMMEQAGYRLALTVVMVLALATAGYFRFQSVKSGEQISRQDEGWWLFLAIRLSGLVLFVATLMFLVAPEMMAWASVPLPDFVRWAGGVLGLLSVWLVYWTLSHLGTNLTDTVVTRAKHTLVTTGPYRWVRHPYYVATLLLVCSALLLSANWFVGLVGVLVFVLLAIRSPIEEQRLRERFGGEYHRYAARTGRFLPRLW